MAQLSDIPPNAILREPREIILIGFAGVEPLDLIGPMSVFTRAEALVPGAYAISIAAPEGGILAARSGISLAGVLPVEAVVRFVDTNLVAGGGEEERKSVW